MKRGPKIPEISDEQIIELLIHKKLTDLQASKILGISRSTIALRRQLLNISPKPKRLSHPLSFEQEQKLQKLYNSGMNDYEVATEMHLGRSRLRKWRRIHGIPSQTNKKGLSSDLCKLIVERHDINGESFDQIARDLNVRRSSIIRLLKRNFYKYESRRRSSPIWAADYILTDKQRAVLVGDMFGDGHIAVSSPKKAYYSCSHKRSQEAFVAWKFNILKPLSNRFYIGDQKDIRDLKKDKTEYVSMSTWSNRELKKWQRKFYPSGRGNKVISCSLVKFLDALGLAAWYMGDGSKSKKTGIFTVGKNIDLEPICLSLNKKFGLLFKTALYEKQWTMTVIDPEKFFKLICPYIISDMLYKIPKQYHHYCTCSSIDFGFIYNNPKFTKETFRNLSDEEKNYLIEDTIVYYRSRGFPYPKYSEKKLKIDFKSLVNFIPKNKDVLISRNIGVKICNQFFPHRFLATRYDRNPMKIWENDIFFRKFIENRFKYFDGYFSDATIRTGIALQGLPTNFNPSIAKYIYDNYLPIRGKTLDFSAGYGGRLLGFLAHGKDCRYVGIEPLTKSFHSLKKMANLCAPWNNIDLHLIEFIRAPFEDLSFKKSSVDLIFSSPPYFGLEIYGDEKTQSIERYSEYNDWLKNFWHVVIDKCFKYLKIGGYFIFTVSNYKKYDLIGDTMKCVLQYSFIKCPSLKISYHNVYKNKKRLEDIFIFKKK